MTHNTPPATAYFNPNRFGFTCRHDIFPGCDENARAYDPRPAQRGKLRWRAACGIWLHCLGLCPRLRGGRAMNGYVCFYKGKRFEVCAGKRR